MSLLLKAVSCAILLTGQEKIIRMDFAVSVPNLFKFYVAELWFSLSTHKPFACI